MRHESVKRRAQAKTRREIVRALLETYPVCVKCRQRPSQDVHEVISRARRPGSHLDIKLGVPICRFPCHDEITRGLHPEWLLPSWTDYDTAVAAVERLRGRPHESPF